MRLDRRVRKGGKRPAGREARRTPTPIYISRRTAVVLAILGAVAAALLLYAASSIVVVAFGGLALAIVLSYPVRALSHIMPRGLAILVTFLVLFGIVLLALGFLVPLLVRQLSAFVATVPAIADRANDLLLDLIQPLEERDLLLVDPQDLMNELVRDLFDRAQEIVEGALSGLIGVISGAVSFGITLFGMIFVAAYLLVDVRKAKAAYLKATPRRYRRDAYELWEAFGVSLSRYLGGLVFVVVLQGVLAWLALTMIGVPYAILLGAWVSVTAIIPYLGPYLGGIPAVIVALTFGSSTFESAATTAILVVVAYFLIQQLEGNFLTPRIQGRALQVHPILVLLAVIGGAQLAGLAGVIFAVPVLAVLRVFFDFFRARLRTGPEEEMPV